MFSHLFKLSITVEKRISFACARSAYGPSRHRTLLWIRDRFDVYEGFVGMPLGRFLEQAWVFCRVTPEACRGGHLWYVV